MDKLLSNIAAGSMRGVNENAWISSPLLFKQKLFFSKSEYGKYLSYNLK